MAKYFGAFIVFAIVLVMLIGVSTTTLLIIRITCPEKSVGELKEMVENMDKKCGAKHNRWFYCEHEEGHEGAHLYCEAKPGNTTREHRWFGDARTAPAGSSSGQVIADVQLLDYFAGQALVSTSRSIYVTNDDIAKDAYSVADAMMAEKKARSATKLSAEHHATMMLELLNEKEFPELHRIIKKNISAMVEARDK